MRGTCRNLAPAPVGADNGRAGAFSCVVRRLGDQRGFILIELIMTMAILGLVVGGITSMLISATKHEARLNLQFQAQESARLALSTLRDDLHQACSVSGTATAITLVEPGSDCQTGATSLTWCAVGNATPYEPWRVPAGSCSTSTTGSRRWVPAAAAVGDRPAGLIAANIFTTGWASHTLPDVAVDFSVTAGNSRPYRLSDTIYLRNGVRQ